MFLLVLYFQSGNLHLFTLVCQGRGLVGVGMSVSGIYKGVKYQGLFILVSLLKRLTSFVMAMFCYALIINLFCFLPVFSILFQKF